MSRIHLKTQIKKSCANAKLEKAAFKKINGHHPLKEAVENIYVGYQAYRRPHATVGYFNFELAKEMGLISQDHPHKLTPQLIEQLLDTFSLQIINEYDIAQKTKIDPQLIKPNKFMATRYLQIQHPNKQGKTSGDGRSIWNGCFSSRKAGNTNKCMWDISSCGTGATRLSPATANENKFFKTGSRMASYGCGRADFSEGITAAIFSRVMLQKGISTEQTLAVLRYKNGNSVNVRVAKNLLRPAHFFGYVKRNERLPLKQLVDYYIQREIYNGRLLSCDKAKEQYQLLLKIIACDFATAAATFESEYIFCWMDWDGDNILMDGGIIDYGTVRQFGLFHHEYRYDDADKMSTNITEQKNKAKYIVQRFAQVIDFLITGKKTNIKCFSQHKSVLEFNQIFKDVLVQRLLLKMGFTQAQQELLFADRKAREVAFDFQKHYRFFEKAVSGRRAYKTSDGVKRDAIFCMRDFLREFPAYYSENNELMPPLQFIAVIASSYSSQRDLIKYEKKAGRIHELQSQYILLVEHCCRLTRVKGEELSNQLFEQLTKRAAVLNPYNMLTGNGVIRMVDRLLKERPKLTSTEFHSVIHQVIADQTNDCFKQAFSKQALFKQTLFKQTKNTKLIAQRIGKMVTKYRETI